MSIISSYNNTFEENSHYLRQIIQLMSSHRISADPINYSVWYEYVTGSNKLLNQAIDDWRDKNEPFDQAFALELYKKFVCSSSIEAFEKINNEFISLMNNTAQTVEASSLKASAATISFQEKSKLLENINSRDDLKQLLAEIVIETNGMTVTSQDLQSKLDKAKKEIEELRIELVQVKESASCDALTGLLNRGFFDTTLEHLVKKNKYSKMCLTLLDLDHFKKVNDTYGHLVGDKVLKFTAKLIKQHTEDAHFAARFGGEEMAIIMPDTHIQKALTVAENIRATLEKSRLKRKDNSESIGVITVSIGIASLKPDDTVESLITRADEALYKAKDNGRNQVVLES
ncbi:GGDEF domain-containing protein [Methylicorpusculum sp.]|uniref:GGDEF domain-containing protein n=2 Tax=Methylicorpusculum sp. TaxID=2713644 RepID=UPI002728457B|nr:GGDEF domain-containing protein [Methylicorpusculum sp.]MDO8846180.1 GGDEF domain-containing protein [Methylicorpusculum sp.]MDP2177916.1 GGDEF domain-containing protein [Methylicorpusculum sp.]MDP3528188.1 GGDEF domain-containing protein [Methylicorpusculum sp.]